MPDTTLAPRVPKVPIGTTVYALRDIEDVYKGIDYLHARAGDAGVIEGYYAEDGAPTVKWPVGFCDVSWSNLSLTPIPT